MPAFVVWGAAQTICLPRITHTRAMTRIAKPEFGTRHYRPAPIPQIEDAPAWWQRLDWLVVSLVVIVFVACFIWLF